MENKISKYYEELGFLSPMELIAFATKIEQMDLPLATLISQLAVLRSKGDIHLEVEFSKRIQSWLRSRIPELEGCVVKMYEEAQDKRLGRKILKCINEEYLLRKSGTEYK